MSLGWKCPKCGRGNAPWVMTCQCGPDISFSSSANTQTGWTCARCGTFVSVGVPHICPRSNATGPIDATVRLA